MEDIVAPHDSWHSRLSEKKLDRPIGNTQALHGQARRLKVNRWPHGYERTSNMPGLAWSHTAPAHIAQHNDRQTKTSPGLTDPFVFFIVISQKRKIYIETPEHVYHSKLLLISKQWCPG